MPGVEIRYLPFEVFNPPKKFSSKLKLAFYKLDVIKDLGKENNGHSN